MFTPRIQPDKSLRESSHIKKSQYTIIYCLIPTAHIPARVWKKESALKEWRMVTGDSLYSLGRMCWPLKSLFPLTSIVSLATNTHVTNCRWILYCPTCMLFIQLPGTQLQHLPTNAHTHLLSILMSFLITTQYTTQSCSFQYRRLIDIHGYNHITSVSLTH